MRTHIFIGGFVLTVLLAACASPVAPAATSATSTGACTSGSASHHAYVVVQHLSGASLQQCVAFSGDAIDGQTLMDRSGVEYTAKSLSSGKVVCQVDNEPKAFTQCFPQKQPYWALFVESSGAWNSVPGGYADVRLHDGEALGWHYVRAGDPAPTPPPLARLV
jgi:hypothetical protein